MHAVGLEALAYCSAILPEHSVLGPLLGKINMAIPNRFTRASYPSKDGKYYRLNKAGVEKVLSPEVSVIHFLNMLKGE